MLFVGEVGDEGVVGALGFAVDDEDYEGAHEAPDQSSNDPGEVNGVVGGHGLGGMEDGVEEEYEPYYGEGEPYADVDEAFFFLLDEKSAHLKHGAGAEDLGRDA